ncbi:MAG: thioredoxin [Candidatus Omnitrophica bacterium]|nr:thioredoxin [Candidatus Omnitrophota bacterium]MCM8806447.1 thioredoxin [Candidatus Omnitrophota bacterium]
MENKYVLNLNKENFEEIIKNNENVIIDFWANWCMPCKIMIPVFEKLAEKYKNKIVFAKVNVDENPEIAEKYKIMSIPTFIFFKNGNKLQEIIGAMSENIFEKKILEIFEITE